MASSTTPTRRTRAGWMASGACTSGSTARHSAATRPACGGAATTSTKASDSLDATPQRDLRALFDQLNLEVVYQPTEHALDVALNLYDDPGHERTDQPPRADLRRTSPGADDRTLLHAMPGDSIWPRRAGSDTGRSGG